MSDCLHCDINELVRERIDGQETVDLADMVARMAESLAELIMLGPKDQWAVLMAEAVRHLGNTVIEDVEGVGSEATHQGVDGTQVVCVRCTSESCRDCPDRSVRQEP